MKSFFIGNIEIKTPVIQGGMGVGISLLSLIHILFEEILVFIFVVNYVRQNLPHAGFGNGLFAKFRKYIRNVIGKYFIGGDD